MAERNDLVEVCQSVFDSSKKIINNNQRNLFVNTLDLITRTTNTINSKFLNDNIIKFLYTDVLELVFDEDINIQNNAIIAMNTILKTVDSNLFQHSVDWPSIRSNILQNYSGKLHSLRNKNNLNWYKVWSLIMRILNQEIIRSASTINIFLSVVEQGFRSSNLQIRAESFICWKTLVEIFAKHDLTSLKRIKLISIPLKSTQAKSELTALHKFKVWWYFIIKLKENGRFLETSEQIFKAFLAFCFGSDTSESQLTSYLAVKEMAVISLIEMLNFSAVEIKYQKEKFELEESTENIINEELFKKHFEFIIRSVYEASKIVFEEFETKKKIMFELLWKSLIDHIVRYEVEESYKKCFHYILLLSKINDPVMKEYLNEIFCFLATNKLFLSIDGINDTQILNVEKVGARIISFSNFVFSSPENFFFINKTLISNICGIECFSKSLKYWNLIQLILEHFLEIFLNNDPNEISNNVDIKLLFWEKFSECLISYLKEKSFEFRIAVKAEILNKWIFLPIEKYSKQLYADLIKTWKELTISASKSQGRSNFLTANSTQISKLNRELEREDYLDEIINTVIECADTTFEQSTYPKEIFMLLITLFSNKEVSSQNLGKILEKFVIYIKKLEQKELNLILNDLIAISKCLQKLVQSKVSVKSDFEMFKKIVQDLISKRCTSNQVKKYKQALKSTDDCVVIPTIWTMNPDRLTEHQKEKMKERKNNLPALYNDMSSHSQESHSLKSWTPNKIVIAKNKDNEEIILPGLNEVIHVQSPRHVKNSTIENITFEKQIENSAENITNIQKKRTEEKNKNAIAALENEKEITNKESVINNQNSDNHLSETNNNIQDCDVNTTDSKISTTENSAKRVKSLRLSISKDDEKLLKQMNVHVDNDETKMQIIKSLKNLEINTVNGKGIVNKKINGVTTRQKAKLNSSSTTKILYNKVEKRRKSANENINTDIVRHTRLTRRSLKQGNDISISKNNSKSTTDYLVNKKPCIKNKSVNSEDEIIQSSQQASESLISRRKTRKSLVNDTNVSPNRVHGSQTNLNKDYKNDSIELKDDSSLKTVELDVDPIDNKQLKDIADIDTELNTDSSVIVVDSVHSEKVIELSSNNLSEINTQVNIEQIVKETNENPCSKNTVQEEFMEVSPNTRCNNINVNKRKSPRKQLDFNDKSEEKSFNSPLRKSLNNLVEKQCLDSPKFSQIIVENKKKSPRKQLDFDDKSEEKDTNSPLRKSLNNLVEKQCLDSPKFSQIIVENKKKSPRKQLDFDDKSEEKDTNSPLRKSLDNFMEEQCLQSPIFSPIKPRIYIEDQLISSILCSPKHQTLESSKEFICNTSNISPISEKALDNTPELCNEKTAYENVLRKECIDSTNEMDNQLSPATSKITGQTLLSSPVDRKKTVNTLSPIPKPKPSTLTGRGAQLINMIRNRKSDGKTLKDACTVKRILDTSVINPSSPCASDNIKSGHTNVITSTPQLLVTKELLTFSKVLPSPYASPTASILKRKANRLSMDDIELQVSKRKRVGFSDPVSMTKEYALQPEEDRTLSNSSARSALHKVLSKLSTYTEQNQKHLLKRKSRVDSMIEIAKYNEDIALSPIQSKKQKTNILQNSILSQPENMQKSSLKQMTPVVILRDDEFESFKLINEDTDSINKEKQDNNDDDILTLALSPKTSVNTSIIFSKDEDVLDYVLSKYTLDDLLLKYAEKTNKTSEDLLTIKSVKILMKEIMNSMALDQKIHAQVFENLSEKYPKDYLAHAIQENLCTVVCDHLDFNSVLNYIFEKSKINNQCYKLLLENIYQMFKTGKYIDDKYELLQNLLKSKLQLSNAEILNCIELLIQHKNIATEISHVSDTGI